MTLESAIAFFRTAETGQFSETLAITRQSGEPTYSGGTYSNPSTSVYSGLGKIRPQRGVGYDEDIGGGDARFHSFVLTVPADTAIAIDDRVAVSASTRDPGLVSRSFRITDVHPDSFQITRKAVVQEVA